MNYLDLVQESVLIMMKAIRLYDMNSEAKLSTYITRSLEKTLPVKIYKYDPNIKVPYQVKIAERKYNNYVKQYQKETGRIPSRQEIQQETKLSDYYMKAVEELSQVKPKSLDETCVDKNKERKLYEFVESEKRYDEEYIQEQDRKILLRSFADLLPADEYYILYYRVITEDIKSLKKVGSELGVSFQAIEQKQNKILKKIKPGIRSIQQKTLKKYDLKDLDTRELVPLEPKLRFALYYLKYNMNQIPYHIIYTKLCDPDKDNFVYYQKQFPQEKREKLEEIMENIPNFMQIFLNEDKIEKIYNLCGQGIKPKKILNLNIAPNENSKEYQENEQFRNLLVSEEILMQILEPTESINMENKIDDQTKKLTKK